MKAGGTKKKLRADGLRGKKKQKTETPLDSPISPALFSAESIKQLRVEHDSSLPYKHVVFHNLCDADRMRIVHDEAKNNMTATFKETDLFKVYQTGELGCIEDSSIKMRQLLALRAALYSAEFREFICSVTGCEELTDRVDCSANAYVTGCHLLCHDDVIGTRRVSYIIYLTDPDDQWAKKDGGALELYPIEESSIVNNGIELGGNQGVPTVNPTVNILPMFNTMAVFSVQPGRSYHSVQEVYGVEKPRLSISGWYHGPVPPVGSDLASLQLIMKEGDDERPFIPIHTDNRTTDTEKTVKIDKEKNEKKESNEKKEIKATDKKGKNGKDDKEEKEIEETGDDEEELELSIPEKKLLSKYVNPIYLENNAIQKINQKFCEDSSVQLKNFLREDVSKGITDATQNCDTKESLGEGRPPVSYTIGEGQGWVAVGPPHKKKHLQYKPEINKTSSSSSPGQLLERVREDLFILPVFAKYLEMLTSLVPKGYRDEVRRFRPGLDYTVAHYGGMTTIPRLDATLCFVNEDRITLDAGDDEEEEKEEKGEDDEDEDDEDDDDEDGEGAWDNGDIGGYECYIISDTAAEGDATLAAEVYTADAEDAEESLLSVSPGSNVLSLVMRDEGIMRFVKYVSAAAPGSRWDIAVEYEIEQSEDSDEESEGEEEGEEDDEEGEEDE